MRYVPGLRGARVLGVAVALIGAAAPAWAQQRPRPRLAIVIVVDQLRGDLPSGVAAELVADDGFRRLWREGVVFEEAFYEHAVTSTAPGHATIFTGAHPSQHGIVENDWFDRAAGRRTASVRSAEFGREPGPYNLLATTIGDELVHACGECKVFAVSGKDRGAILPGGKLGKAFWFDTRNGGFRSARYYYDRGVPAWVGDWDQAHRDSYPTTWALLRPPSAYRMYAQDDRPFERPPAPMGRTFPHPLGTPGDEDYYDALEPTPFLDALTLEFARALIDAEELGSDSNPDLLALSLSSTDHIGHVFGPRSLEAEDNLLRLDRELAGFIGFLDRKLGRDQYVLVLTADHGVGATPEYSAGLGMAARRIDMRALRAKLDSQLAMELGINWPPVLAFVKPYVYLDRERLADNGIPLETASRTAAALLAREPGIAYAFSTNALPSDPDLAQLVAASIMPGRSGDVFVIPDRGSALVGGSDSDSAFHGTPYTEDRYVPIYFFGAGIAPARVSRHVSPRAIAPTLAELLDIPRPSAAAAAALPEVIEGPGRAAAR